VIKTSTCRGGIYAALVHLMAVNGSNDGPQHVKPLFLSPLRGFLGFLLP